MLEFFKKFNHYKNINPNHTKIVIGFSELLRELKIKELRELYIDDIRYQDDLGNNFIIGANKVHNTFSNVIKSQVDASDFSNTQLAFISYYGNANSTNPFEYKGFPCILFSTVDETRIIFPFVGNNKIVLIQTLVYGEKVKGALKDILYVL